MSWEKRKRDWSAVVITVSTLIFAVVSLISVFVTVASWQAQREAARPYFTFKESPTVHLTDGLTFEFKFKNVGTHPATNLVSKTFVFNQNLSQKPVLIDKYAVVNDIPRDTTTSLLVQVDKKDVNLKEYDINPHFIVISLSYSDPILNQSYTQNIYIKWAGMIDGKQQPLIHAELNEKEAILKYLKSYHLFEP